MGVLLVRNIWVIGSNVTTIEAWEIERHETLIRRARARGGYLDGPDGLKLKIRKQEFPYDIGIYQNAKQAMGGHFLTWLSPLSRTPSNASGLGFETNGFEDPGTPWPPPDPDRVPRRQYNIDDHDPFRQDAGSPQPDVQAFRERQEKDAMRFTDPTKTTLTLRTPLGGQSHIITDDPRKLSQAAASRQHHAGTGPEWRDSEDNTLRDFGVDEEAEEDDVPLAEILARKKYIRYDR
ncbi:MAG: hypothetical protein Q9207_007186 [Kuettlingeria erythrocarpa]